MTGNFKLHFLLVITISLLSFGCAKLEYVKVPTPTQYGNWTDKDQRKADEMKGVRYYLPRPFLSLKQSVPIAQRVAFVSVKINAEKTAYEVILPPNAPTWLKQIMPTQISTRQMLSVSLIKPPKDREELELQSETHDGPNEKEEKDQKVDEKPPSELTARTGFISDTDPVTRLGDRMDVVYLPDFEEQFVIRPDVGLGLIDIETRLRNGWAAEVFSQKVDNSNLIPYVIRQVESASEAASGIFTTWAPLAMGVPPGSVPTPKELKENLELQSEDIPGEKIEELLGSVILLKVAEVKIAQPGLYPILKPREIRQWFKSTSIISGEDPQNTFEIYLQQANLPWIRPDMAFIPAPPVTMVGFNITTDVFIASATKQISLMEDTRPLASLDNSLEKKRAAIESNLNDRLFRGKPQKVTVKTEGQTLVVYVKHFSAAPPSYTDTDREKLRSDIEKAAQELGIETFIKRIELPPSKEKLDDLMSRLNTELKTKEGGAGHWKIVSLRVEENETHICEYSREGNDPTALEFQEENFQEKVENGFNNFLKDESAGPREIKCSKK